MKLTTEQIVKLLKKKQGDLTQQEFAETLGITGALLSYVYNGKREPGAAILNYLGYEREVIYRKV